jgi:hypothetical protein
MTPQPLDPRKSPWKRGDLCTRGFKTAGFVLSYTPEYLEIRWSGNDGIEKVPTHEIDDIVRVAHADDISPAGDNKTNLETLQALEALEHVRDAIAARMANINSEKERQEANALAERSFNPRCNFDRKHTKLLFDLAIVPDRISLYWKLRERLHRFIHHH